MAITMNIAGFEFTISEGEEIAYLFIGGDEYMRSPNVKALHASIEDANTGHHGWDEAQKTNRYNVPHLGRWHTD